MNLTFTNPIIFPTNLARSKAFYRDIMKLNIIQDSEPFVLFENGFAIHGDRDIFWQQTMDNQIPINPSSSSHNKNLLLYFRTTQIEQDFASLKAHVDVIHPIKQQDWGERIFRFYDPDQYVIEIGQLDSLP